MEQNHSENTKRIAKNTLMLYGRMLFSMFVSLYTSRVVLATLGVEDFGISNAVGGVIAMLGFLNDSMSGATARFLTYELGKGNVDKLKDTFSTSVIIHIGIALFIFIFGETIGLWFLENKLVIPEPRMMAARIVYQTTIIGTMLGIMQTPYNATIIAHEKMSVYAYVGILNVFLRLLVVYLLVIGDFDKLILYAFLQLSVSIIIILIYRIYCKTHFNETRFTFVWKKELLQPMLSFSGWDLYGNLSVIARTQGVSILLNMFFGPIANAAAGIASQVQGAVMSFAGNIVTAVRPQLVKYYATEEYHPMFELLSNSIKLSFILLSILTIPIITEINYILKLWLGNVPQNAAIFCAFTLLFNLFANTSLLFASIIHATGRVKRISLINGSLYLLVIPVTYIAFRNSNIIWLPYLFNVIAVFCGMLSNAWTIHLYIDEFNFKRFIIRDLLPCIAVFISVFAVVSIIPSIITSGFLRLMLTGVLSSILLIALGYQFLLSPDYRTRLLNFIKNKICKRD